MKNRTWLVASMVVASSFSGAAQAPAPRAARPTEPPHSRPDAMTWRLAEAEQRYAGIDKARLMQYVEEQTAIARRYRDNGHPQFWGRIIGSEADAENANWMMQKFREFGLSDVHQQSFDLPPQW